VFLRADHRQGSRYPQMEDELDETRKLDPKEDFAPPWLRAPEEHSSEHSPGHEDAAPPKTPREPGGGPGEASAALPPRSKEADVPRESLAERVKQRLGRR
jgi:hypothetical protein